MKLREFKEPQEQDPNTLEVGYNNAVKKSDTRRARLTLEHLNKLRAMRELRAQQQAEEQKHYGVIYARAQA